MAIPVENSLPSGWKDLDQCKSCRTIIVSIPRSSSPGPSRAELSRLADLDPNTVDVHVQALGDGGIVRVSGSAGRKKAIDVLWNASLRHNAWRKHLGTDKSPEERLIAAIMSALDALEVAPDHPLTPTEIHWAELRGRLKAVDRELKADPTLVPAALDIPEPWLEENDGRHPEAADVDTLLRKMKFYLEFPPRSPGGP